MLRKDFTDARTVLSTATYRQHFQVLQVLLGDRDQSLLRPLVEPVDGRGIDKGRELAGTDAEGGTDG